MGMVRHISSTADDRYTFEARKGNAQSDADVGSHPEQSLGCH